MITKPISKMLDILKIFQNFTQTQSWGDSTGLTTFKAGSTVHDISGIFRRKIPGEKSLTERHRKSIYNIIFEIYKIKNFAWFFFHESDLEFRLCKLIFKRTNVSSIKFLVQIEKKAYLACPNQINLLYLCYRNQLVGHDGFSAVFLYQYFIFWDSIPYYHGLWIPL